MPSRERKVKYFAKVNKLFAEYQRMFIVGVDNVGSKQMQDIKMTLRGKAEVLNGKNTQMRRAISDLSNERPELWCLIEMLKQNVAFVMTNGDLAEVKKVLDSNQVSARPRGAGPRSRRQREHRLWQRMAGGAGRNSARARPRIRSRSSASGPRALRRPQVPAAARAGSHAPVDVFIPAGPTGLDPAQTSFFQALNIPTKINKGSIEIIQEVQVVKKDTRVRRASTPHAL
jgi:large subunit ribosomal protein LP0